MQKLEQLDQLEKSIKDRNKRHFKSYKIAWGFIISANVVNVTMVVSVIFGG